ncbi:putative hydrolase of the HAD superfamily [Paenibacillus cellulosilyticus]|uniref:Putative hydrolase of the HAD superfamily n=1 Tax=Paenibacillus cellulosilyticus TaxID=375489 RepID=A0A2V2YM41_9BACL|nr:HAD-IA family hydrolase [Paenibacillus cellulosilyticus]PWV95189.1 putative hydrolase of the HAD superfamily [Paenibacillus cellulosilyticus]QKS46057.1 HAD-IA family hydrolase [Paenibacillus cellulosilyticus]
MMFNDDHKGASKLPVKVQLVLDVGGVLLSNLTPTFWTQLADRTGVDYADIRSRYKREIRDDLWSGAAEEPQFWQWMNQYCITLTEEEGRAMIMDNLVPLPSLERLDRWKQLADLHILSNHRTEWLSPKLADHAHHFTSMTVSSSAGCFKPDLRIYQHAVDAIGTANGPVLFIDDSAANLEKAQSLGWSVLIADPAGEWMNKVEPIMQQLLESYREE